MNAISRLLLRAALLAAASATAVFWNQRRKYGTELDSALLWARAPRLFLGVATLYGMELVGSKAEHQVQRSG